MPGPQVAVSPGRHVIAHEAHAPTAGALHDAPLSFFSFLEAVVFLRLWSSAATDWPVDTNNAATTSAISNRINTSPKAGYGFTASTSSASFA